MDDIQFTFVHQKKKKWPFGMRTTTDSVSILVVSCAIHDGTVNRRHPCHVYMNVKRSWLRWNAQTSIKISEYFDFATENICSAWLRYW